MKHMPGKFMSTIRFSLPRPLLAGACRGAQRLGLAWATLLAPVAAMALNPNYSAWEKDWPQYAVLALKPGVDTRGTVIAALGKPEAAFSQVRDDVPHDVREACESSVYQHRFDNVLLYEGRLSIKPGGVPYKGEQSLALYFDEQGFLCGGNLQRVWTLPGAVTGVQWLLLDYPGKGWLGGEWKESAHRFR